MFCQHCESPDGRAYLICVVHADGQEDGEHSHTESTALCEQCRKQVERKLTRVRKGPRVTWEPSLN